ncbi:hypothetical protein [Peptostreptococcus porci]|uniref:hypothetical protein n=1 Tax=Peptostreptococcus porci TaxID=2652282 RepID=UPI002A7FF62B|nr:hypothetical protein [Peptostreptococcus porci]MDY4127699.1 hypothetical protein [Peptostreptococcus porci]
MFSKLKEICNNLTKLDPYERVFTNYNIEITLHNGEVYIYNDNKYWAWDSDDYIRYEILRKDKPILVCDGYEYIEVSVSFLLDDYLIAENGSEDNIIYDIKKRMQECFLDGVKNIEGTLRYEGWQGGDCIDDYIINGVYLKDFLLNKDGKKIKIEIMD